MGSVGLVVSFAHLFAGRTDAYGADAGGCVREPVTLAMFHRHLGGVEGVGIYPIRPIGGQAMVRWGCSDIDYDDYSAAAAVAAEFTDLGVFAHIERSRSKGFHVWVFAADWVPAACMRRCLLVAHEQARVPAVEVNPKQESLEGLSKGFGNYVRLPYSGGVVNAKPARQVALWSEHEEQSLSEFLEVAKGSLCVPQRLAEIAGCYAPPEPRFVAPGANGGPLAWPEGEAAELAQKAGGLAYTIFKEGPLEGSDRSTTMARLAHVCADNGLSPTETFKVLAGLSWSKFLDRPDHDLQVLKLVEQAF